MFPIPSISLCPPQISYRFHSLSVTTTDIAWYIFRKQLNAKMKSMFQLNEIYLANYFLLPVYWTEFSILEISVIVIKCLKTFLFVIKFCMKVCLFKIYLDYSNWIQITHHVYRKYIFLLYKENKCIKIYKIIIISVLLLLLLFSLILFF